MTWSRTRIVGFRQREVARVTNLHPFPGDPDRKHLMVVHGIDGVRAVIDRAEVQVEFGNWADAQAWQQSAQKEQGQETRTA